MHAVIGQVEIDAARADEAQQLLADFAVPAAKGFAGFQSGTWARTEDATSGHSFLLFDTAEHAHDAAAALSGMPPEGAPARFVSATVCEVLAQA